jgi:hypothetical protein
VVATENIIDANDKDMSMTKDDFTTTYLNATMLRSTMHKTTIGSTDINNEDEESSLIEELTTKKMLHEQIKLKWDQIIINLRQLSSQCIEKYKLGNDVVIPENKLFDEEYIAELYKQYLDKTSDKIETEFLSVILNFI